MDLIGLTTKDPVWYRVLIRTVIVFITALAFIRISGMRTFLYNPLYWKQMVL